MGERQDEVDEGHRPVGTTRRRPNAAGVTAVALLLAVAVAGACSPGDDEVEADDGIEGVDLGDGGGGGQPSAEEDVEAVTGLVEDLLAGYEETVNAIVVDQSVALDDGSAEIEAYRALFEPGSEAVADAVEGWRANAEAGVEYRATDPSKPPIGSWLDGDLEVVSGDEVTFPTCDEHHMETLDGDGRVVETIEVVGMAGEGVAVRVGGRWYLRDLELLPDAPACDTDRPGGTDETDTDSTDDTETEGP